MHIKRYMLKSLHHLTNVMIGPSYTSGFVWFIACLMKNCWAQDPTTSNWQHQCHMWQMIWENLCMYCWCMLTLDMTVDHARMSTPPLCTGVCVCVCGGGMSPNIYRAKRLQSSAVLLPIFLLFSYFLITYTTPFHHCMYVAMYKRCTPMDSAHSAFHALTIAKPAVMFSPKFKSLY